MYKIGVIGDKDSILGFKALGIAVFPITDPVSAGRKLQELAKDEYAIIFVTEQVAKEINEYINLYKNSVLPAIILIPSNQGSLGIGIAQVKQSVEKAIGSDILFGERG